MGGKKGITVEKKTIGIITFHQALNYGAVLQAYALKTVCETLGATVHIIDYEYGGIEEKLAPVSKFIHARNKRNAVVPLVRSLLGYPWDKNRERAFHKFRSKYLNESSKCNDARDIAALGYDVLIGGSDQIWNRGITLHRYDPVFFMNFQTDAKKILYGASSEDVPFQNVKEQEFKEALEGLQGSVSIREEKLANYVEKLINVKYPVVVDPTLLAGREVLDTIKTQEVFSEPYILIYQIDANPESDISIKSLENKFECPVYTMTVPRIGDFYHRKGEAGPEEFLSLLKGAKFIVTNSFHGIALSVIYQKQFFVYENTGVMSRIDGLLNQLELSDRKVKMCKDISQDNLIDYEKVSEKISIMRKKSMEFLVQAINKE